MKLLSCHIEGFGALVGADIGFRGGITQFHYENGSGKTTLADFLKAMFYGLPSVRKNGAFNARVRYAPFSGARFGGSLVFSAGGKTYRIERTFDRTSEARDLLRVYEEGTPVRMEEPGKFLFGMDEASFERTAFLTSDEIELSPTADIDARLNRFVMAADGAGIERAYALLDRAAKRYKAARGSNDLISRTAEEAVRLGGECERIRALEERLGEQYARREELVREIGRGKEAEAARLAATLADQRWETYDSIAEDERRTREEAERRYPHGLPTAEECAKVSEAAKELAALGMHTEGEDGRRKELEKLFARGVPSEREIAEAEHGKRGGLRTVLFLLAALLLAGGAALLFVQTIAGASVMALGVLVAVLAFFRKEGKSDLFSRYGLEGEPARAAAALRALISEYDRLRTDHVRDEARQNEISRRISALRATCTDILSRYGIVPDFSDLSGQLRGISSAIGERDTLLARAEELRRRAENFRREYGLTVRPARESRAREDDGMRAQRELAALDGRIAEAEALVEALPARERAYREAEERLKGYRARYDLLVRTRTYLAEAEKSMKARYLGPVQQRYEKFALLLECALGEKVVMDREMHLSFERAGELRSAEHLSAGQRALAALCIRLALLEGMYPDESPFLVMDDPFTGLDEAHMARVRALLAELAKRYQIVYFCCHPARTVL